MGPLYRSRSKSARVRCRLQPERLDRITLLEVEPEPIDQPVPQAEKSATVHDEFKTHLRGGQRVLRSKTSALVQQEAWGFLLAHFALRALMHEAALGALPRARDPDTMSFVHVVRVPRRTLSHLAAIPPSGPTALARRTPARTARGDRELQPRALRAARRQTQDE